MENNPAGRAGYADRELRRRSQPHFCADERSRECYDGFHIHRCARYRRRGSQPHPGAGNHRDSGNDRYYPQ